MPLDKMPDSKEYAPTHKSVVLHVREEPVACIVDDSANPPYHLLYGNASLRASLVGFLNKDDHLGLLFGFQLKIKTDEAFFQFTAYPDEEFVDTVIFDEQIHIINKNLDRLFSVRIGTDQFVKTKSEYEKFQKMIT